MHVRRLCLLALLACLAAAPCGRAQPAQMLNALRAGHPRLLLTSQDQARLAERAASDTLLALLLKETQVRANRALSEPTVRYELVGPRLLAQSRSAIDRILPLALTYRLTRNHVYLERAAQEMRAAAALKDWNPSHFLDVAEMTTALAIGYDWLKLGLTEEERAAVRTAIIEKGLQPGLRAYRENAFWVKDRPSNWTQVCNAGLLLGALAVAYEAPDLAEAVVRNVYASIPHGMESYRPDGQYVEGPSYWEYAATYNALLIEALRTAMGEDWGLPEAPGFAATADYFIHMITPARRLYNYADGGPGFGTAPVLGWLARNFERPDQAAFYRALLRERLQAPPAKPGKNLLGGRFLALEALWCPPEPSGRLRPAPLDALFRGEGDVAALRSSWRGDALYVGFKGGKNNASHAHLDIGSFILEADGVRWALDLGPDDYNLPGYWSFGEDGKRWSYFRLNNLSHNTLAVGGKRQKAAAVSRATAFASTPARAHAVMDLSEAYAGQAARVRRGVALLNRRRVLVQDELEGVQEGAEVRWAMATEAEVKIDGRRAALTQGGKTLHAEILSPAGARFELASTDPGDDRQHQNKGARMLVAHVESRGRKTPMRIAVLLTPVGRGWGRMAAPALTPLSAWKNTHPEIKAEAATPRQAPK